MSYRVRERFVNGELSVREFAAGLLVAVVLFIVPFVLESYLVSLFITVLLFAIFGTAFNLLYGYTGLLSFGHAMFVAVAAYTTVKVFNLIGPMLGFPELFGGVSVLATFGLAVVLGTSLATLLAVLVGYFSVRLEEIYFAMITLSFSMAFFVILLQDITGQLSSGLGPTIHKLLATNGDDGLSISYEAMGQVNLFGLKFTFMDITSYLVYYFIVLLFFVGSMFALWRIIRSPFGAVCLAIRENPERARALGIDVTRHSWVTFIVSGTFTGLVGVLYAPLVSSIIPGIGHWSFSAIPVLVTVIGGPYSFVGPTVGAFVYQVLRYAIDQVPAFAARWQLVFGFILLFVVLFFENGVVGGIKRLWAWIDRAREQYRNDGISGITNFIGGTIASWFRLVRQTIVR